MCRLFLWNKTTQMVVIDRTKLWFFPTSIVCCFWYSINHVIDTMIDPLLHYWLKSIFLLLIDITFNFFQVIIQSKSSMFYWYIFINMIKIFKFASLMQILNISYSKIPHMVPCTNFFPFHILGIRQVPHQPEYYDHILCCLVSFY